MTTKTITIQARNLKAGDILVSGAKVLTAQVREIVGYGMKEVFITDDKQPKTSTPGLTYLGWTCAPDTELRVTRAA